MKKEINYFLITYVIIILSSVLRGHISESRENKPIKQNEIRTTEETWEARTEPREGFKLEAKIEEISQKKEGIQEIKSDEKVKTIQWKLNRAEETEPPKLIWKETIEGDYIDEAYILDEKRKETLVKENPSLSEILSEKILSPYFLLKGGKSQYLMDIKGSIKKIEYPSLEMIIVFDGKAKKVSGKTRGGNILWEKEWEGGKYEISMISPDGSWAILLPMPNSGYGSDEGEHIVAVDRNGKQLWRVRLTERWDQEGLTTWPIFSETGSRIVFGAGRTLYYASKEKILWQKASRELMSWYELKISPSGNIIILPGIDFINNKGSTVCRVKNIEDLIPWKYGFAKKENYVLILGFKKIPRQSPFFIAVLDMNKGKVIKKTKEWIRSASSDYWGILKHSSYIKVFGNKYLMVCFPSKDISEIHLYEILHVLRDAK